MHSCSIRNFKILYATGSSFQRSSLYSPAPVANGMAKCYMLKGTHFSVPVAYAISKFYMVRGTNFSARPHIFAPLYHIGFQNPICSGDLILGSPAAYRISKSYMLRGAHFNVPPRIFAPLWHSTLYWGSALMKQTSY